MFSALLTVSSLTLVAKVATTGKELVIAERFGTGSDLDAYLIAFLAPTFAMSVITGSFTSSIIPSYVQVREQDGPAAAQRLIGSILALAAGLVSATCLLLAALAPVLLRLLGPGLDEPQQNLGRQLFLLLLPALFANGLATVYGALLNADERYAVAALAPALTPLMPVAVLLVVGREVQALALGTVAGYALEAAVLAAFLAVAGFPVLPRWSGMTPSLRRAVRQYGALAAGASLMSSTVLVDLSMATLLGKGSVSTLNYGGKLTAFVLGVGAVALSAAVLPQFAKLAAVGQFDVIEDVLRRWSRYILVASIPLTVVLIVLSRPIVEVLFERGAFTERDTLEVATVQALLLVQVPFYLLGTLVVRLISALHGNSYLTWGALLSIVLNIGLNAALMPFLGVAGIALSTSLVYAASWLFLRTLLRRLLVTRRTEASAAP